jgi:hypothetical protein
MYLHIPTAILTKVSNKSLNQEHPWSEQQADDSPRVTKVLVPIVHCPMGLVDKLLESFTDYIWKEVFLLTPEEDLIQKQMQAIDQQMASSKILLQSKRESSKSKKDAYNESKTPTNEEEHKRAQEEESKAQAEKPKLYEKEQRQRKHSTK